MPKQTYEQFMDGEFVGQIYGMATSSSVITSRKVAIATGVGLAGKIGIDGVFTVGHNAGVVDGITIRQQTQEAANRPALVTDKLIYPAGKVVPIGERCLAVIEYTGIAPTSKDIYVNDTTGAWASEAGAGLTLAVNVKISRVLPPKPGYAKKRAVVEIV